MQYYCVSVTSRIAWYFFYLAEGNFLYKLFKYSLELDSDVLYSDRCAPCRLELRQLAYRKQELHTVAVRSRDWADQVSWRPPLPPPSWRLRGSLVAHLHEHRGAISKYDTSPLVPQ
jgi:hypothetical protein